MERIPLFVEMQVQVLLSILLNYLSVLGIKSSK